MVTFGWKRIFVLSIILVKSWFISQCLLQLDSQELSIEAKWIRNMDYSCLVVLFFRWDERQSWWNKSWNSWRLHRTQIRKSDFITMEKWVLNPRSVEMHINNGVSPEMLKSAAGNGSLLREACKSLMSIWILFGVALENSSKPKSFLNINPALYAALVSAPTSSPRVPWMS